MKWGFTKGDVVIIWGKVRHVRADGSLDIDVHRDKLLFSIDPSLVTLAMDPEAEEDEDWDGLD